MRGERLRGTAGRRRGIGPEGAEAAVGSDGPVRGCKRAGGVGVWDRPLAEAAPGPVRVEGPGDRCGWKDMGSVLIKGIGAG